MNQNHEITRKITLNSQRVPHIEVDMLTMFKFITKDLILMGYDASYVLLDLRKKNREKVHYIMHHDVDRQSDLFDGIPLKFCYYRKEIGGLYEYQVEDEIRERFAVRGKEEKMLVKRNKKRQEE